MSEAEPTLLAACSGRDLHRDGWPSVSVVIPVRNEAPHLERAVASILTQDYPDQFDVCLAVGPSEDGTEEIAAVLAAEYHRVVVVANPSGRTPAGLNAAIAGTAGSVVVRVDGHAELSDGYIRCAVETMCRTGAVNVGGRQVPKPESPFEEAVAAATTSWIGTGGPAYRVGGEAGSVDTVYLGVFDRRAGDRVGWFDESLIRNQDYELNIRLRAAGGIVWYEPRLTVSYRPRASWRRLARQYYEYGFWKAEVLRREPGSLRIRQAIPPIAVSGALSGLVLARWWRGTLLLPLGYAGAVVAASAGSRDAHRVAGVLATIHGSWSLGLLVGSFSRRRAAT